MIKGKTTDLDFLEEFGKFVKASLQGKRTKQNGARLLRGSVRKLEITFLTLKEFSDAKHFDLKIKVFKKYNARDMERQKSYWKKFYQKFSDYLYNDLNCYDNYAGSVIKDIRTFFNYLITEKNLLIGNYHKKFYIYKEDIEIITLQPDDCIISFVIRPLKILYHESYCVLRIFSLLVVQLP